jgi:LuxR family transcriptional regulator, maltose regulon positive regulatory protein
MAGPAKGKILQDSNISRKITQPALPSIFLHRDSLVSTLQEAILCETWRHSARAVNKLVLLCAPAGYGKSTLLADFASSESMPCCWYFLEKADTDIVVFLQTMFASLRQTFPGFGQLLTGLGSLFRRENHSPSDIYKPAIDALCNAIASDVPERFALFLCNYETINESGTLTELINYLITKLPPQAVLVIESRAIPHIEFAHLIVRSEMFVLNQDTLRFSAQEIVELAKIHGLTTLTQTDAEQLTNYFDGWITGILLGTYLGDFRILPRGQSTSLQRTKSITDPRRRNLFAYAVNEVFQRDPAIYDFLQPASILQYMEVEMCNTLLGITNAEALLSRLEQQGLFVSYYESDTRTIYTCHPVIRDLLTTQLRENDLDRFSTLHRQAAEIWLASQNYDQAMHHAFEARSYDMVTQLILDTYQAFLRQGRVDTLANWLCSLPSAIRESTPRLLLVKAAIATARGQHTSALPVLEKASTLIAGVPISDNAAEMHRLQAETNILLAEVLCRTGDYLQAQALCQQALQDLSEQDGELRSALKMRMGICANVLGDFLAGILHLQEALRCWDSQIPAHQALVIHGALVNAYYLAGNFPLADYHLTRSLSYCEEMNDELGMVDNLLRKGIISKDQGRYAESETILLEVQRLAHNSLFSQHREAHALTNLGDLCLDQGKYFQALAFCEDALALAHRREDLHLIRVILINMSLAHLLVGDPTSALLFLDKVDFPDGSEDQPNAGKIWRDLTYSLILLYQQRYDEAYACLTHLEKTLRTARPQREYMQVQLRLAACQLLRKRETEMQGLLTDVTSVLTRDSHYKPLVLIELRCLPELFQVVKCYPQLAHLRELLALEAEMPQKTKASEAVVSEVITSSSSWTPQLAIRAFGEPVVLLDDQPIKRWRMARGMELFFLLLGADYPLSKERIITEIWQDCDEKTNQTFHSTLHYLRKLFGASSFSLLEGGYRLNLAVRYGEKVWYDVQTFRTCYAEAEQALSSSDDSAARTALLQMVKLYRGDYGRSFYSDWCLFRRDELRATYLNARRHLAHLAWRSGTLEESIEHWQHILHVDNCLEEAHLGLMQCYARQGKRSTALRQYQQCKETLHQELGIEVGVPIQQLYQHLTR